MRIRSIAFILCAAIVFMVSGCKNNSEPSVSSLDTASVKSLYSKASETVNAATTLTVQVDTAKKTTLGDQTFSENSQHAVNYNGRGSDDVQVSVDGRITIGRKTITHAEQYRDGKIYLTLNGSGFSGVITGADYLARYAPAVPLSMTLYAQAKAESITGGTSLSFTDPTGAEAWALPEDATFLSASASAILNPDNSLVSSTYTVTYTMGTATVTESTTVTVLSIQEANVVSPGEETGYIPLEYPDAPIVTEKASAYLLQATKIQAATVKNITCEAFAINRDQTTALTLSGTDSAFRAELNVDVHQINQSKGGEVTNIQQTELFENGIYTISSNGNEPTKNPAVDMTTMQEYCQNILVSTILLPEHITGASVTETETAYRITFTASQKLAEAICSDVCNTLYGDPNLLDTLASSYNTEAVECYLELDKYTGLPVASGLQHRTTHTIEEISYLLTSQTEQTYRYE